MLILSASAGAGHVRAAQALERAFVASGAVRQVRHVDTLEFTNKVFRRLYAQAYIDLVNKAPEVLGWLYDWLDTPWENSIFHISPMYEFLHSQGHERRTRQPGRPASCPQGLRKRRIFVQCGEPTVSATTGREQMQQGVRMRGTR